MNGMNRWFVDSLCCVLLLSFHWNHFGKLKIDIIENQKPQRTTQIDIFFSSYFWWMSLVKSHPKFCWTIWFVVVVVADFVVSIYFHLLLACNGRKQIITKSKTFSRLSFAIYLLMFPLEWRNSWLKRERETELKKNR